MKIKVGDVVTPSQGHLLGETGVVRVIKGAQIGVEFSSNFYCCHNLNGTISQPRGYFYPEDFLIKLQPVKDIIKNICK